jgi:hypothetical protein
MLDEKPVQKTLMTAPGNSKVSNHMDLSNNVIKNYLSGSRLLLNEYFFLANSSAKIISKVNFLACVFLFFF